MKEAGQPRRIFGVWEYRHLDQWAYVGGGAYWGGALSFNGSTSYVDAGNAPNLNQSFTGLSVCAWVYPNVLSGVQTIVGQWAHNAVNDHIGLFTQDTSVLFAVGDGSTPEFGITTGTLVASAWQHVCGTWKNTRAYAVYVNGSLVGTGTQSGNGSSTHSNQSLKIGREITGADRPFSGYIDDVRIYNRALSAAEVAVLYAYTGP